MARANTNIQAGPAKVGDEAVNPPNHEAPEDPSGLSATPGIETRIPSPDDKYRHSAVVAEKPEALQRKRYEVINPREINVLYNGAYSTMKPGKIVDDVAYDIPLLKRQGVKLQEVPLEVAE